MFFEPYLRSGKEGNVVSFDLNVTSDDIMIRGGDLYAYWDEKREIWERDKNTLPKLIDNALFEYSRYISEPHRVLTCASYETKQWQKVNNYLTSIPDRWEPLDERVTFQGERCKKGDLISRCVPYSLSEAPCTNYDKLMSTLYDPTNRERLEWGVGCALLGKAHDIQKMFVLYGPPGSGKSTYLSIMEKLFEGYTAQIDIANIINARPFALAPFEKNPIVAIQPEVDMSRVRANEILNSIVAHDPVMIEKKYGQPYSAVINTLLFLATNKPVQITDAWSGLKRRLVVIEPTGDKLEKDDYLNVMSGCMFELGSIARHCMGVYERLGPSYLDDYVPESMIETTDYFHTFIMDNYEYFASQDKVTGKDAYRIYRAYMEDNGYNFTLNATDFRRELKKYFRHFSSDTTINGTRMKSVYRDFILESGTIEFGREKWRIELKAQDSLLDVELANCPAQKSNQFGTPEKSWDACATILSDIYTRNEHWVRPPLQHIVIDFDLKDETGEKSLERNLEAASLFPPTYAEVSKGGNGLHLHYIYDGDVTQLSSLYSEGIEVKVFKGKSALRRKLSLCNDIPIAVISSGLPTKGVPMINTERVVSERSLRMLILRALRKEIHPATKPNIDFIRHILDEAYASTTQYDVRDLMQAITNFAAQSTNNTTYCLEQVAQMKFTNASELAEFHSTDKPWDREVDEKDLVFFDIEVFPNLVVICWKIKGDPRIMAVTNPKQPFISEFIKQPLVGFNNRRYDNHILYGLLMGYDNTAIYHLSQDLVANKRNALFREAYNISYTDVYDFASAPNKKSLKKWEIALGIFHMENEFPWDQPVPEEKWPLIVEYCKNDVSATENVFDHIHSDFVARVILAKLAGGTTNDTTNQLTTKIIFGDEKNPQDKLVYTDLRETFPGYKFEVGKSTYKGYDVGEGGFVYSKPGYYENVTCNDVAAMHPTSIEQLNYLGPFTERYSQLKKARIHIKHKDLDALRAILGSEIMDYINSVQLSLKDLSNALKTALNSVYGLTAAHFSNPFRHPDNVDNIVAKRGALFMIDLLEACLEKGYEVIHIKTDSIKIANSTAESEKFVQEFGRKYGYEFEIENRYERICLVNKAVYIGLTIGDEWDATGAQFAHPYIYKTLFTKEQLKEQDYWETKAVSNGAMYLRYSDGDNERYDFVGRVASFIPVTDGYGGELLCCRNDKYDAVTGTKGYSWVEAYGKKDLGLYDHLDMSYYRTLVDEAKATIEEYVPFDEFVTKTVPF